MGNNKFKLSSMFPNTFLYKLKYFFTKPPPKTTPVINDNKFSISDQVEPTKTTVAPLDHCGLRKSYHFSRELPLPPPGDPQTETRKPTEESRAGTRTRFKPDEPSSSFDIVINVDEWGYKPDTYSMNGFGFKLPRIITKPDRPVQGIKPVGPVQPKGYSVKSPSFGVRLRINSPKIMGIKQGQNGNYTCRKSVKKRRSILESLVVVKSSDDPQRDFNESMVEMIVENNLKGSKDLEDLLACYLSLNSDEYHDVIIQVFKQIWFDLIR